MKPTERSYFNDGQPEKCIQSYLTDGRSKTARVLAQKAMIGLYPEKLFSKILWYKDSRD